MPKLSPLSEAASLMDQIIDESLDCQEQILRQNLRQIPDFAKLLERILSIKNKVSTHFYNQLESLITSLRPAQNNLLPPPLSGN